MPGIAVSNVLITLLKVDNACDVLVRYVVGSTAEPGETFFATPTALVAGLVAAGLKMFHSGDLIMVGQANAPQGLRQEVANLLRPYLQQVVAFPAQGQLGALAYTQGNSIFFGQGSNIFVGDVTSKQLLAHELTHVIQQQQGQ